MDLDRQSIEKRDFPIGRRGYDPEAVDEHLTVIAGEVESLRRAARTRPAGTPSLAAAASAQVQAIVEAAETTAAEIERQADDEGRRVRQEAERAAGQTRDEAVERARSHVESVSNATSLMLQRVDAMESELAALVESLRTGANRLTADLALLEGNMGDLYDASGRGRAALSPAAQAFELEEAGEELEAEAVVEREPSQRLVADEDEPEPVIEPEAEVEAEPEPYVPEPEPQPYVPEPEPEPEAYVIEPEPEPEAYVIEPEPEPEPERLRPEPAAARAPEPAPAAAASGGDQADLDGARLIALNMALNGQSREEADRYLADNFDIADRQTLLDEVYSAVDG